MSRQAQAERERQARVILGESEMQIAHSFSEASKAYINNPTALHLRAMNMLFEGLETKRRPGHRPQQCCRHHEPGWIKRHGLPGAE